PRPLTRAVRLSNSRHLSDGGDGEAPGALHPPAVLVEVLGLAGVELVVLPRADPVVVDEPPHRRPEIAHDDPELQRLGEHRLAHRPEPACHEWCSVSARAAIPNEPANQPFREVAGSSPVAPVHEAPPGCPRPETGRTTSGRLGTRSPRTGPSLRVA